MEKFPAASEATASGKDSKSARRPMLEPGRADDADAGGEVVGHVVHPHVRRIPCSETVIAAQIFKL